MSYKVTQVTEIMSNINAVTCNLCNLSIKEIIIKYGY